MGVTQIIEGFLGKTQRVQFIHSSSGTIFTVECTLKEDHSRDSPPTRFPVEDGSNVSDHTIISPIVLELTGSISDSPINPLDSVISTVMGKVLPVSGLLIAGAGLALASALSKSDRPSIANFKQLLKLQDNRTIFTVVTSLARYENMIIKSIKVPREAASANELLFTLSLEQIIIVTPKTVSLAKFQQSDIAAAQADVGSQEANSYFKKGVVAGNTAVTGAVNSTLRTTF